MFTVNPQAVKAEDKYRRELLRDQNRTSSRPGKLTVLVLTSAMLLAACGAAPETHTPNVDVVAAVSDPGPTWGQSTSVLGVSSFGVFAGPPWRPDLSQMPDYMTMEDFGVFEGPSWSVSQTALDRALGVDRNAGVPGDSEPSGHPNYGRLETYLGGGSGSESGPR